MGSRLDFLSKANTLSTVQHSVSSNEVSTSTDPQPRGRFNMFTLSPHSSSHSRSRISTTRTGNSRDLLWNSVTRHAVCSLLYLAVKE